jgi:hypothetical protein
MYIRNFFFEPELLFLYAYSNDNLEDKSYALITYVGWNSEKTLNQLIRLVKKRNLSFIEVEKDAVKILYGEAKKKMLFRIQLLNKYN